jgi:hypothetical protein
MAEKGNSNEVISSYPFSEDEKSDSDGQEVFVCPKCDREFATKRGLNIHRGQQHDQEGK